MIISWILWKLRLRASRFGGQARLRFVFGRLVGSGFFDGQEHVCAVRTRYRTFDADNSLCGVGGHNGSVLQGDPLVTHVSRHLVEFQNSSRLSTHADRPGFSLEVASVGRGAAGEVVTTHDALKSFSFAGRNNGHERIDGQHLGRHLLPRLHAIQCFELPLLLKTIAGVLLSFATPPGFGPDTEHNGVITVLLLRLRADNGIRLALQIRHRNGFSSREKHARHAELLGDESCHISEVQ